MKKISIVGLGYIGLPTAAIFAEHGCEVVGTDINRSVVDTINRGEIHIVEPGLEEMVQKAVSKGLLRASLKVEPADVFIIAVPTPFMNNHEPDLSYVKKAVMAVAPELRPGNLIILESTSPVGTTSQVVKWLKEIRQDLVFPSAASEVADVQIAYCPERVLPGQILRELVYNDRIIGGVSIACSEAAKNLYSIFVLGKCHVTNSQTAEMCKLTENAFRDVNIAFANELSQICDSLSINVWELISLANHHPRVNILQPGPGVGGHCIAVDPWFIVHSAPTQSKLIKQAREVNDGKPHYLIRKILEAANLVVNPKIALFGLTYKPNVDDFRESPALEIARNVILNSKDAEFMVVEPYAENLGIYLPNDAQVLLVSTEHAIDTANILVLLVDHDEFLTIPPEKLAGKHVIDSRGCWIGYAHASG
jgi:UDP-N-acetyl-D-mannosaminuronic acid dehydrogenase